MEGGGGARARARTGAGVGAGIGAGATSVVVGIVVGGIAVDRGEGEVDEVGEGAAVDVVGRDGDDRGAGERGQG